MPGGGWPLGLMTVLCGASAAEATGGHGDHAGGRREAAVPSDGVRSTDEHIWKLRMKPDFS